VPPPLTDWQALAMRAFMDLSGERAVASEFIGPIYWRAISAWCDRYRVPNLEAFVELVQAIDRDYLNAESSKRAGKQDSPAAPRHKRH
jgi:hypothetical protein